MKVWICTDLEGVSGIDRYEQCYPSSKSNRQYRQALEELTEETNAAIEGCFDAGAEEVWVLDGHGPNDYGGFSPNLDIRARKVPCPEPGGRWLGLDQDTDSVVVIGQHAMAGTLGGFLDHTESIEVVHRMSVNGRDIGELGMMALYAGSFGVPISFVSGDEALCSESNGLFSSVPTIATKKGLSWDRCQLYQTEKVRGQIRSRIASALQKNENKAMSFDGPLLMELEYNLTRHADSAASCSQCERVDARTLRWTIPSGRNVFRLPLGKC